MPPLRTPMSLGAALSAGLAASLVSATPAHAFVPGEPAPPINCVEQSGSIFATDFACILGDKVFSNFENLSSGTQFDNLQISTLSFFEADPNFSVSITPLSGTAYLPGTFSFGYSITVFDALATGERIKSISTSASSSAQGGTNPNYVQTLTAIPTLVGPGELLGGFKTAEETRLGNLITNDGAIDLDTPAISADFVSTLIVNPGTGNFVSNVNSSVIQLKEPPGETVPGPLPILGAGAAFGLSRKLRSRIRQTS